MVIFGGSFDPVHLGHIRLATELLLCHNITELRFIPCAENPDKLPLQATAKERLTMLRLLERDKIRVDDCEIKRGGVSYTLDTLRLIRAEVGDDMPLAFAIGTDILQTIEQWNGVEQLAQLTHLIVFKRPGSDDCAPTLWQECSGLKDLSTTAAGRYTLLDNELMNISSTAIRDMLAQQEQPRYLLPGAVWSYIRRNELYGWRGA